MIEEFLWVEKHRPTKIADTILPTSLKSTFQQFVDQKNIPNLILSGSAGVGKTTVARAMLEELDCDYIIINASMNGNIDTLRNEILSFASSVSFSGGRKYVILDEADYLNCLDENEKVRLFNGDTVCLKDMEDGKQYEVVSFNVESGAFEQNMAEVVHRTTQMIYEIELENGAVCRLTDDHPIMCKSPEGTIVQRTIKEGLDGYMIIVDDTK